MSRSKKLNLFLVGMLFGILFGLALMSKSASASMRTERINKVLDVIVDVCADEWDRYHGYPTTCAMMAAQESLFGQAGRQNNLWGLNCGRASYGSLEEGVRAWLRCINNGWYPGAAAADNCDAQLDILLSHGYCQPPGRYFYYCMKLKDMYNLGELDERMFRELKRRRQLKRTRERQALREKPMTIVYDPSLSPWQVVTYRGVVGSGMIRINVENPLYTWLDVVYTKKGKKTVIYSGNKELVMLHPVVKLEEVREEVVG